MWHGWVFASTHELMNDDPDSYIKSVNYKFPSFANF